MNVSNSSSRVTNTNATSQLQKVIAKPIKKEVSAAAPKQLPIKDRVELSSTTQTAKTAKAQQGFRADKVAKVKAELEAGTYLTPVKEHIAMDKLLDDLMK
jgi:anti-sigma28 factor (negative regulator of flagellin synthesis)